MIVQDLLSSQLCRVPPSFIGLIKKVFVTTEINVWGVYVVQLFVNGSWEQVRSEAPGDQIRSKCTGCGNMFHLSGLIWGWM